MHWFLDPITKHYADFSGRASRKQYWMFVLGHALFIFGSVFLGTAIVSDANDFGFMVWAGLFMLTWLGLFLIPSLSIQVRRLHDIGLSGWWYFLSFIPYVGGLILLIMSCIPSEQKTNKYGPNPYGVQADDLSSTSPAPTPVAPTEASGTTPDSHN